MCPDLSSVPNSWMSRLQLEHFNLPFCSSKDVILLELTFCTERRSALQIDRKGVKKKGAVP